MSTAIVDTAASRHWRRLLSFLGREFREILPPTLFFFVGFNLILLTKRLILEDYLIQYAGFLVATTSALLVGKSVLVANTMPFLRRFDNAPLVYPILFKDTRLHVVRFRGPPNRGANSLPHWRWCFGRRPILRASHRHLLLVAFYRRAAMDLCAFSDLHNRE